MNCKLKEEPPIQYSHSELRVFYLLGRNPRNTTDLTDAFYRGRKKPYNARQAVTTYLRSLDKKMAENDETCKVISTRRRGPNPIEWMLVPRQLSKSQQMAMVRTRLKSIKKRIEAA